MTSQLRSTTCPYCGVGCGIDVKCSTKADGRIGLSDLAGQPEHPANYGKLCVKGSHLLETNDLSNRMLRPSIGNETVSWDKAITKVAAAFSQAIAQYGPDSVAMYVSGQLLTEDYYVANKFMKGFVGSANIDTNSRLCMSSAVAAYKRAFGSDAVPCCYEDIEQTDLFIMVGSNAAWTHPVLYQRLERAKLRNPNLQIVCIDPRKTVSCDIAQQHLALRPGTDGYLFNGLLAYLSKHDHLDSDFIAQHTLGFEQAIESAKQCDIHSVARECDLKASQVERFYRSFAEADAALSFFSMGINQSSSGVDKANAIINCHLATGKIGKAGSGPFSITGQPNAMGGREVGGLANLLAAHMELDNPEHRQWVQDFWQSPQIASRSGYKAIELFEALNSGKIKVLWIMATNPVVSMPNRNLVEQALSRCPMVIVSDVVEHNDTLAYAHIKLPATAWSEKNGTVTNSERRISRQRSLQLPPGECRDDWRIIRDVANAMGFQSGFSYVNAAQIFDEHTKLTALNNHSQRALDLSALSNMSNKQYDNLIPIQWPVNRQNPQGTKRLFCDKRFYTPSHKAHFVAIAPQLPQQQTSNDFPLVLNTGRLRDQWHTMTRTAKALRLTEHTDEGFISMHPDTAKERMFEEGQLLSISSWASGDETVVLRCKFDRGLRKNQCFAPIHFSQQHASSPSVARLFDQSCDPISGQPELKHAAIEIESFHCKSFVDLYSAARLPSHFLADMDYWSMTPIADGYFYRIASHSSLSDIVSSFSSLISAQCQRYEKITPLSVSIISTLEERLTLAFFADRCAPKTSKEWLSALFASDSVGQENISALLRNQPSEQFLQGELICSCFGVRKNSIHQAIASGCRSVSDLGKSLKCGTNCGSCKGELARLIQEHTATDVNSPDALLSPPISLSQKNTIAVQNIAPHEVTK